MSATRRVKFMPKINDGSTVSWIAGVGGNQGGGQISSSVFWHHGSTEVLVVGHFSYP